MLEPEHTKITRQVGARIRELRRDRGISQQDLADLSQMHPTNLGRLERGKGNPKLDTLARIALALDTTLANIVIVVTNDLIQPKEHLRVTAKDLIEARTKQADMHSPADGPQ